MVDVRRLLGELYDTAVAAAHPAVCLPAHLPPLPAGDGRLITLAVGKAAIAMAAAAEAHYRRLDGLARIVGLATAPCGYREAFAGAPLEHFRILEGRHPIPDATSEAAAKAALALAETARAGDHVLVLLSGGASALWAAPAHGVTLADKIALTRGLLKCGADIHEMNVVRRHLSRIKGGRLRAVAAGAGAFTTLAISDVPGDDPATIGSGPTVPDATTLHDARTVLARREGHMAALGLAIPSSVRNALLNPANETPKPGDSLFRSDVYRVVATPVAALEAAAALARRHGYEVAMLGDRVSGEAREVANEHARLALEARAAGRRLAIVSGGELSVTVRHSSGRGGRSQEYALALAVAIEGADGVAALAADTDGIDGGDGHVNDPAGAMVFADTVVHGCSKGLNARLFLDRNDATTYFEAVGGLVRRGPTHTNVNDFRVILIDPPTRQGAEQ